MTGGDSEAAPAGTARGGGGTTRWAGLGLAAAFLTGFSAVSVHNFNGWDEWLVLSLTSKGVTSFPYANRPLALLWALPGALGLPGSLGGYWAVHAAYLCLAGLVVLALARRLAPREPMVALLSAAFALTWVPLDPHRLDPLNNLMYSGATFAALLALLCFVLWACGRGLFALGTGVVMALLATRSYEGTLGLLAGGGAVLLVALGRQRSRPLGTAVLPWAATVALAAALVAVPVVFGGPNYQVSGLGLDASPMGVTSRLLGQLRWHLAPLLSVPPREILSWRALLAAVALGVTVSATGVRKDALWERRRLVELAVAGLALAVSGWGIMLLSPALGGPERMQGFSAPGVGLLLGSAAGLVAGAAPGRWRVGVAALLGGWVVAAGTGHTLALQHRWDEESVYPRQARLLRELVRIAPGAKEGTLVLLLDDEGTFLASFTFRHAVEYLYSGRVLGAVPAGHDFLYPLRFGADGVTSEPWPVIREPWGEPVRRFAYDDLIVVRSHTGALTLLDRWPSPPLPGTGDPARYAPRSRIAPGPAPARAVLLGS